jgi:deazaflavin-dependent oxidoreductase (nitroreductase family)
MTDWNTQIIEEFRANAGAVGGQFQGAPLLLLHSVGARSGLPRVHPMMYQAVGDAFAVFASKAGADTNPAWYHNLLANPEASIEVGTETIEVTARVLDAAEREPVWREQKRRYPGFADYETNTSRVIPVVLLERRPSPVTGRSASA